MGIQQIVSAGFFCFILIFAFFIWPNNKWHFLPMNEIRFSHKVVIVFSLLVTVLVTILPMSLSPYWNGTMVYRADKQQYDKLGDSLLMGHLYIDNNDIDPALEAMVNPYDSEERKKSGVKIHWDEAYYNHHYYMYFGIVPTIILFIPYKLISGQALLSHQATQIFASFSIIGLFYLFYVLCRRFPFSLYLLLSMVFSVLSIGYSISAPALYCTAIVSAVCFMVWSVICFLKGAWLVKENKNSMLYLMAGAFFGALAFGCRPPAALANIIVAAVVFQVYENNNIADSGKLNKLIGIIVPYLIIGILLMTYNYARFDNLFEFGQSYQLTLADQHDYGSFENSFNLKRILLGTFLNFYAKSEFDDSFPFIWFNGVFFNFPILLLSFRIFSKDISLALKQKKLYFIAFLMLIAPVIISMFDVHWTPFLLERYHLDFYYLLCIDSFIAIAIWLDLTSENRKTVILSFITLLAFAVLAVEFLFFCIPYDGNYTFWYPEALDEIYRGLRFGL